MRKLPKFQHQVASELASNFGQSIRELVCCGQHRSQRATFVELQIQVSGFKERTTGEQKFHQMFSVAQQESEEEFVVPAFSFSVML